MGVHKASHEVGAGDSDGGRRVCASGPLGGRHAERGAGRQPTRPAHAQHRDDQRSRTAVPALARGSAHAQYLPYVPLGQGIRFGVAILSYEGRLAFGVTGDFDAAPDVDVLTKAIDHAMSELLDAARSRSHARRSA